MVWVRVWGWIFRNSGPSVVVLDIQGLEFGIWDLGFRSFRSWGLRQEALTPAESVLIYIFIQERGHSFKDSSRRVDMYSHIHPGDRTYIHRFIQERRYIFIDLFRREDMY